MAKNGQNFISLQHLQANSLQITKKHMMKLPGMKKKQCFSNPTQLVGHCRPNGPEDTAF